MRYIVQMSIDVSIPFEDSITRWYYDSLDRATRRLRSIMRFYHGRILEAVYDTNGNVLKYIPLN